MNDNAPDTLLDELRPTAFAVAYRMLGSVAEAEDVTQEALVRVNTALENGDELDSPQAFVTTVATRLAIDVLRSARVRRENYVGEWLPEPLVDESAPDPEGHAEMADSLSLAFLVLLESLSPEQRAVLLLHDVFDYSYDEIADVVGKSVDNTRQIGTRARRHVEDAKPRFEASSARREALADSFFAAAQEGDVKALEEMLAHDVVLHGDAGGRGSALREPRHGKSQVAKVLAFWSTATGPYGRPTMHRALVNGQPGARVVDGQGGLISVIALDIADGVVQGVKAIANPDKLGHVGPSSRYWLDREKDA
jgi:RNA polymerase sigma-70 factor (ECF subfamily)